MRRHAHVDRPTHANLGQLQSVLVVRLLLVLPADRLGLGQGPRCRPVRRTLECAGMALCCLNLQLILVLLNRLLQEPLERPVGAEGSPAPNATVQVLEGRALDVFQAQRRPCSQTCMPVDHCAPLQLALWRATLLGNASLIHPAMTLPPMKRGDIRCACRGCVFPFDVQGRRLDGHSDRGKLLLRRLLEEVQNGVRLRAAGEAGGIARLPPQWLALARVQRLRVYMQKT